jgi:tRNA dimethylallyltransferase
MRRTPLRMKYLISVCGATGIGKTQWAIDLARHYRTEILSADSRQFYREMQIGTAVPSDAQLEAVAHHFIRHKSIHEPYTVGDFKRDASERLSDLFRTHDHVLLVGGSGLYLDAVTKGLDEFPETAPGVRENLEMTYRREGLGVLQQRLSELDPDYYKRADMENPRRVLRALEVCLSGGKPYSSYLGRRKPPQGFLHIPLGIEAPRAVIYDRIGQRVEQMMAAGLLAEAAALLPCRELTALQTVGYQELFAYLDGDTDLETAVEAIKRNTRRFAKRQGTWFRKNPEIRWIPYDAPLEEALQHIEQFKATPNGG